MCCDHFPQQILQQKVTSLIANVSINLEVLINLEGLICHLKVNITEPAICNDLTLLARYQKGHSHTQKPPTSFLKRPQQTKLNQEMAEGFCVCNSVLIIKKTCSNCIWSSTINQSINQSIYFRHKHNAHIIARMHARTHARTHTHTHTHTHTQKPLVFSTPVACTPGDC